MSDEQGPMRQHDRTYQSSGRKRKAYVVDDETVECPCPSCHPTKRRKSRRTVRRHMKGVGLGPGPNDVDLGPAEGIDDGPAGQPIAEPPWTEGVSPSVVSQFTASAGNMTVGALITLALAVQLRHHLSGLASLTFIEGFICASLAALPLLAARRQFKSLSTTRAAGALVPCPRVRRVCQGARGREPLPGLSSGPLRWQGDASPCHPPPPPPHPHTHTPPPTHRGVNRVHCRIAHGGGHPTGPSLQYDT
jgi:hypothetical protein